MRHEADHTLVTEAAESPAMPFVTPGRGTGEQGCADGWGSASSDTAGRDLGYAAASCTRQLSSENVRSCASARSFT